MLKESSSTNTEVNREDLPIYKIKFPLVKPPLKTNYISKFTDQNQVKITAWNYSLIILQNNFLTQIISEKLKIN